MGAINRNSLSSRQIWITTHKSGWIQEIKSRGPIVTPILVPSRIVLRMVQNGRKVYEHNPENKRQKVLLTVQNFDKVKIWDEEGNCTITKQVINQSVAGEFSMKRTAAKPATTKVEEPAKPVETEKIDYTVFKHEENSDVSETEVENVFAKNEVKATVETQESPVEEIVSVAVEESVTVEQDEVAEKNEATEMVEETTVQTQQVQQNNNQQGKKNQKSQNQGNKNNKQK